MTKQWLPTAIDDYEAWMAETWHSAADRFAVQPCGQPTPTASIHSIGGPVLYRGETVWLRAAPFDESGMDIEVWTGTRDAGPLTGIRKPDLFDSVEWTRWDPVPVRVCAELMTHVTDPPAVPGNQYLDRPVDLSPSWLGDLRASLDALAGQPTKREIWSNRPDRYGYLLHSLFGRPLPADVAPRWGSTEHLDLHWGNVTVPNLTILDWERWGANIAGYGAARLYCTALAVPSVARQIYTTFADVLDSPAGRYAILVNIADIITDFTWYEDPINLCGALHQAARAILS